MYKAYSKLGSLTPNVCVNQSLHVPLGGNRWRNDVMRVQDIRKKKVQSWQMFREDIHSDDGTGLTEVSTAVLVPKTATNTAEAACSALRKCKWLFVSGCKSKSPICTATEF
jgi:hypothetical protein